MKFSLLAWGIFGSLLHGSAFSQQAEPSQVAAPEIYRVIAEDAKFRVIEAIWKPGEKDVWHSHPATSIQYHVRDCAMRLHTPDGKSRDVKPEAGTARIAPAVESHYAENIGSAECKIVFVEAK